jgi:histidinol phosphatase-like enzyme
VIFGTEGVLHRARSGDARPRRPDEVEVLPGRREALARVREAGLPAFALAWRPEISEGRASREDVLACFARARELLGGPVEFQLCPHAGGPPACWCRKPLPGLAVLLVERHRLDPGRCLYVGEGGAERRFARRLGFRYREAAEFFAPP